MLQFNDVVSSTGMAFQSISQYNAPPVFQTLVSNRQATAGVFAMKLTQSGAEMTLGSVDNTLFTGQIANVPVTQEGFWQIEFEALAANGKNVVGTTPCIVDSVRLPKCYLINGSLADSYYRVQLLSLVTKNQLPHSMPKSLALKMPLLH